MAARGNQARDRQREVLRLLRAYESRNVTFINERAGWPIVWQRARGVQVWDVEGRRYVDFTAAFGVAAAGHANPRVVRAGQRQMQTLLHAMGDVHPHPGKAQLCRELSRLTFERWTGGAGKCLLGNSGFEAVEAALKTALLATGRRSILAFEGGYHGLGYGALNATHREYFRQPFRSQLAQFGRFVPFPETAADLGRLERTVTGWSRREAPGAVLLVEPVQGRGGIRVPPPGFLGWLRQYCDHQGALLVCDEVYTGFGRTGRWFACEHESVAPDLICLGKALTGGFPLSACVGRADVMDAAWPVSAGEALHTSTFLGHPVGCAMALAQIRELTRLGLVERSERLGQRLLRGLSNVRPPTGLHLQARGLGLMAGLELHRANGAPATQAAGDLVLALLQRGYVVLPEGEFGEVVSFTPPLTIEEKVIDRCVRVLQEELERPSRPAAGIAQGGERRE